MSGTIFVEGGGDPIRCRAAFRKLLERCGFRGRMPAIFDCGSRNSAFDDFRTAHDNSAPGEYIALLIDSEVPVKDVEQPWSHLIEHDRWERPNGVSDEQVLLMTTCMETWIATDRKALKAHYGSRLQENALPDVTDMESRNRRSIFSALVRATQKCKKSYSKGKESFLVLQQLDPAELRQHLPSFVRAERILNQKL